MSMNKNHYIGFYLMCYGDKKTDKSSVIDMYRIQDESGNKLFNQYHFYIPNIKKDLCYHLDKHSETGVLGLGKIELFPLWLEEYFDRLEDLYDFVEVEYGIINYVN